MTEHLRIVVADDEGDMRQYYRKILPRLGHEVVGIAANGQELIDLCQRHEPDLVISDVRMPVLCGREAITAVLRARAVPVILVSAYGEMEPPNCAESDHVVCHLVKPVGRSDLAPAIARTYHRFQNRKKVKKTASTDLPGTLPTLTQSPDLLA
jgi:response regulator NasT